MILNGPMVYTGHRHISLKKLILKLKLILTNKIA